VVAGHDDGAADPLRLAQEDRGALELAGARALRQVARDGDHVEVPGLDARLERLDVRRHGGTAEVQVGDVQQAQHGARGGVAARASATRGGGPRARR
jgi:hypothetical protein